MSPVKIKREVMITKRRLDKDTITTVGKVNETTNATTQKEKTKKMIFEHVFSHSISF